MTQLDQTTSTHKYLHSALPLGKAELCEFLFKARWFAGKSQEIDNLEVHTCIQLEIKSTVYYLLLLNVGQGMEVYTYFLPLKKSSIKTENDFYVDQNFFWSDATFDEDFRTHLYHNIIHHASLNGDQAAVLFESNSTDLDIAFQSRLIGVEQSNTTMVFNEKYYLKLYRKLFEGVNPEYEVSKFLTEQSASFMPKFAGGFYLKTKNNTNISLGLMLNKVEHEKDAWLYFLELIADYMEHPSHDFKDLFETDNLSELAKAIHEMVKTTAHMHQTLALGKNESEFSSADFNLQYIQHTKAEFINLINHRAQAMQDQLSKLDEEVKELVLIVLNQIDNIKAIASNYEFLGQIGSRTRIHGDYHLGQILVNQKKYFILDFEGEPEKNMLQRKTKHSPFKDLAGLIRSLNYAMFAVLFKTNASVSEKWLANFNEHLTTLVIDTYLQVYNENGQITLNRQDVEQLLKFHLLEKAVYEIGYELNYRPQWLKIPLTGILQLVKN